MAVYGVEMAASSVVHFACYWGQLSQRYPVGAGTREWASFGDKWLGRCFCVEQVTTVLEVEMGLVHWKNRREAKAA